MRISVVTPTHRRERFLPGLYRDFAAQDHADRELLIWDDSPQPSAFCGGLNDPRVTYVHLAGPLSVGEKRNQMVAAASGDLIACFDDDDHYAPHYLSTMAARLGSADLVKLIGWFALSVPDREFLFWDTSRVDLVHQKVGQGAMGLAMGESFAPHFCAKNMDGYGFSYLFRRHLTAMPQFPAVNFGEDLAFVTALREAGGQVQHTTDDQGLALHILHEANSSLIFPQYRLPYALLPRLFPAYAGPA